MTVNVGDVVEIAVRMEANGVEDVVNVYQFKNNDVSGFSDAIFMDSMDDFFDDLYEPLISGQADTFVYRDMTFRNVTKSLLMGVRTFPVLTAGESVTPQLPPGVAGLINLPTGIPRVILKKYVGGFVISLIEEDGSFTAAITALLATMAADLLIGPFGVLANVDYGHLSPKTMAFEIPTSGLATDIPAYQRRRKQGRGS